MFDFAERYQPQRVMFKKMETPLFETPSYARPCKMTEASGEKHTFDFQVGFLTFGQGLFLREAIRENTIFDLGRSGNAIFDPAE